MRKLLLLLLPVSASAVAPVITPSIPAVYVSSAMQMFADQSVTWSLMPGSTGTISAAGLYTAPGPIQPKKVIYGCALQPQDHFSTTNISNLPVLTSSTNYLRAQIGSAQLTPEPDMPTNILYNTSITTPVVTLYTPSNDGTFPIPNAYEARFETGLFADKDVDKDTHLISVNVDTCEAPEMYKFYRKGSQAGCPTCNSQSVVNVTNSYSNDQGVTAGGLSILQLEYTFREIDECVRFGKPIQHAGRIMASNGVLANAHKWPAKAHAAYGGELPVGTWVRLVSTYTVTGSAAAQCIQQAQKSFGLVFDDAGISGHYSMEQSAIATYDYFSILNELAGISEYKVRNLEVIDASVLIDTNTASPTYLGERVTSTNSYVVPSHYAVVVASNTSTGEWSMMPLIIQPVTIGTEREEGYTFIPGAPQTQIPLWVHGAADTTFSCSMSPTLGSLTAGGAYTPPSTSFTRSSTTVTCTATADPANAYIRFPVIVSSGTVRVRMANATNTNYTDSNGNTWFIDEGSSWRLQGRANCDWRAETWTGVTDQDLYQECQYVSDSPGDWLWKAYAPNGTYQINLHFAVGDAFAADTWVFGIDSQNSIYTGSGATTLSGDGGWTAYGLTGYRVDLCDIIGACTSDTPGTVTLNVDVTDNELYVAVRHLTINGSNSRNSLINAFEIIRTGGVAGEQTHSNKVLGTHKFIGGVTVR